MEGVPPLEIPIRFKPGQVPDWATPEKARLKDVSEAHNRATRDRINFAQRANKEETDNLTRALGYQTEARTRAGKEQLAAAKRAYQDQNAVAKQSADWETMLQREKLAASTTAFKQQAAEEARIDRDRYAEARQQTKNLLEAQARAADEELANQLASAAAIKKGTDETRKRIAALKGQTTATKEAAGAAGQLGGAFSKAGDSLGTFLKAQMGLAAIQATGNAIAAQFRETAEYILSAAKEFQGLRKSMQEVATLKGSANTNEFTIDEAKKAQAFNLTPQEYRDFQAEFQNYAGAQIGGENGKLTAEQGEQYAGRVAELMKASGINPAIGAELAGSLLEQSEGPQDVDKMIQKLSTTFNVLEKGRVPLAQALPQISQIMAHGVGAEEAAQMFSIVAPASPKDPGVAVEAAMKALDKMKATGKGAEFGVVPGMTQFEAMRAFAENITGRETSLTSGGMSQQLAADAVQKLLIEKDVVPDVREARGLVAGFGRLGVKKGAFKTFGDIAKGTGDDFESARRTRYEDSAQGRQDKIDAAQAVANAALGQRNEALLKRRQIAEVELTEGRAFEHVPWLDRAVGLLPFGDSVREQQINRQTIRRARGELGEGVTARDSAISGSTALTNELMRGLLVRLDRVAENTKKTADATKAPTLSPDKLSPPGVARRE